MSMSKKAFLHSIVINTKNCQSDIKFAQGYVENFMIYNPCLHEYYLVSLIIQNKLQCLS